MERNTNLLSRRNKSKRLKDKNYLAKFNKLNVYSHMKDNKVHLGIKPEEVYELFNGNTCGTKKGIREDDNKDTNSSSSSSYLSLSLGIAFTHLRFPSLSLGL